jgi:hypothetical protein
LSLKPPPADFASFSLPTVTLAPARALIRISKHDSGEPFFGCQSKIEMSYRRLSTDVVFLVGCESCLQRFEFT